MRNAVRPRGDDAVMNDDVTLADATAELEPPSTEVAYAWGSEPDDDFTMPADHVDQPSTGAPVLAVATLAGVAFAVAAVAAVVVLVTPPRTDHYDLRPMPAQALPEPPKAALAPAPKPPPVAVPAPVIVQAARSGTPGSKRFELSIELSAPSCDLCSIQHLLFSFG
jgi:hypothetical protein